MTPPSAARPVTTYLRRCGQRLGLRPRRKRVIRGASGTTSCAAARATTVLLGRPGRDTLYGGGGADGLNAQDGRRSNDVANGGSGADSCTSDPGDVVSSC